MAYFFVPRGSVHVVTNTIPIRQIEQELKSQNSEFVIIVCASKFLFKSYYPLTKNTNKCKLIYVPNNFIIKIIYYLLVVGLVKLLGIKIVFYHECCNPCLDLCIHFFAPHGVFRPQVTLECWTEIPYWDYPSKKLVKIMQLLKVLEKFKFYRSTQLEGKPEFGVTFKQYPKSIECIEQNLEQMPNPKRKSKKILLLVSVSIGTSIEVRNVYLNIIRIANEAGFRCYVKDHPNSRFRLQLNGEGWTQLDASVPVELLNDDYFVIIGLNSTALGRYTDRAFSIINLVNGLAEVDKFTIRQHYEGIGALANIREFSGLGDVKEILASYK